MHLVLAAPVEDPTLTTNCGPRIPGFGTLIRPPTAFIQLTSSSSFFTTVQILYKHVTDN